MAEAHGVGDRCFVKVCGTCMHTPLYCSCKLYSWSSPQAAKVAPAPEYGKDKLEELAQTLDAAGGAIYAAVLRVNLSIALNAAHEIGFDAGYEAGCETGYDAAKESVGEWLERLEP